MAAQSTTVSIDRDVAGAAPLSIAAFNEDYDRASARRSAERKANWMRRTHIHGVEREIVESTLKSLASDENAVNWATGLTFVKGELVAYSKKLYVCVVPHTVGTTFDASKFVLARQAYIDHISRVHVDSCYAACMPVPACDEPRQPTLMKQADGSWKRVARKPAHATAEQRWVVSRDTYLREQAERYRDCPWSPVGDNATKSGEERFQLEGYVWSGSDAFPGNTGRINGKYFQNDFIELDARTELNPLLKRFPAGAARPGKGALAGPHKDDRRYYQFKRAIMDCIYITAGDVIEWLRVDVDAEFASIEVLEQLLQAKVDAGVLPCMPHVISWIFDDRYPGVVINPHLIWLLPVGRGVYYPKDEKKREELKLQGKATGETSYRLYKAVAEALHIACIDLGADLGGVENPADIKNPVSPHCWFAIPNGDEFLSLSEMAKLLDVRINADYFAQRAVRREMQAAGITDKNSQRFFVWSRRAGLPIAQELYLTREPIWDPRSSVFDHAHFQAEIAKELTASVPATIAPRNSRERETLKKAIEMRAEYLAVHFDPARLDIRPRDRGAAAHLIPPGADETTRKSVGRTYGHGSQVRNSQDAITEAYKQAIRLGLPMTQKAIGQAARRCRNTVGTHGRACLERAKLELYAEAIEAIKHTSKPILLVQIDDEPTTSEDRKSDAKTMGPEIAPEQPEVPRTIWCREGVGLETANTIILQPTLDAGTPEPATPPEPEPDIVGLADWDAEDELPTEESRPEPRWVFGRRPKRPDPVYRDVLAELMGDSLVTAETFERRMLETDFLEHVRLSHGY